MSAFGTSSNSDSNTNFDISGLMVWAFPIIGLALVLATAEFLKQRLFKLKK